MKRLKFTLLFLMASLSGCAATEITSLDALQNNQIRMLALSCYNSNRGFQLVYGGPAVWEACRFRAEDRVLRPQLVTPE